MASTRITTGPPSETLELHAEVQHLRREVQRLRLENEQLRARVAVFEDHPSIAEGIRGESIVALWLDAVRTSYNAEFDVTLPSQGITIEIKFSRLNDAVRGRARPTYRWAWSKPFGESGNKKFDRLILIGEIDPRFKDQYLDPKCPYIFFDVPFDEIMPLTIQTNAGRYRSIQLTTNPASRRDSAATPLFSRYQLTLAGLESRYGM